MATAQTTELADCPTATPANFGTNILCSSVVGATLYEWTFTPTGGGAATVHVTNWHSIKLADAGLNTLGVTYDVSIRNNSTGAFGAAGLTCQVVAPAGVGATSISSAFCGGAPPLPQFFTNIPCASVPGATEYEFEITDPSNNVTMYTNTSNGMRLSSAGLYDVNTLYSIRVRAKIGATAGAYSAVCTVTSPTNVPATALQTCGLVVTSFNQNIAAINVTGASQYKFEFYDIGTTNLVATTIETFRNTKLSTAGLFTPNQQYDVRVSVTMGSGTTFSAPGAICTVLSPSIVEYTSLGASCGFKASAFTDVFTCDAVAGATNYDFEFTDITNPGNPVLTASSATTSMDMATAGITANNTTYSVRVRATVNGVLGLYGLACNVFTPETVPIPNLVASDCGVTLTSYFEGITSTTSAGVVGWRFNFFNTTPGAPSPNTTFDKNHHTVSLGEVGLTDPGITYDVTVAVTLDGTTYTSFGTVCQVTSPAINSSAYNTGLTAANCGATMGSINQSFATNPVFGATNYDYEFENTTTNVVTVFSKGWHVTSLLEAGLDEIGASYNVRVRATVGGVVGAYSTTCGITAPSTVPATQLVASLCNSSTPLANYNSLISVDQVVGANEYTFEFTNPGTGASFQHVRTYKATTLNLAGISNPNTTYSVRVQARIGSTYGPFGATCTFVTPLVPPAMILNDNGAVANNVAESSSNSGNRLGEDFEFTVFPNPASGVVNITSDIADYTLTIFSADGKVVHQVINQNNLSEVSLDDFSEGIYVVSIANNDRTLFETKKLSVIK